MPVTLSFPGVYIEEIPSGVRTIVGVATSITAFIGRALRGPTDDPIAIESVADFDRVFGGLWVESTLGYAVQQFFLNGGSDAVVVRVAKNALAAKIPVPGASGPLPLEAANPGAWGTNLRVRIDNNTRPLEPGEGANTLFNLTVKDIGSATVEVFRNVSVDPNNRRYVQHVLQEQSQLLVVNGSVPAQAPNPNAAVGPGVDPFSDPPPVPNSYTPVTTPGDDGVAIDDSVVDPITGPADKTGMYALEKADLFNILSIPPFSRDNGDPLQSTWASADQLCKKHRAMLILDPPSGWTRVSTAVSNADSDFASVGRDNNAAVYFPRLRISDPLKENRLEDFVPSGVVAGIWARVDATRGVWKAPAGQETVMAGVRELTVKMNDAENGQLNPIGINCLRTFPVIGNVVWGARTYQGADLLASEWKYIPVRRTALFIEESLYRGTKWVVFEPNDEPLWSQIRLNVGAFMQDLFRKGAFQGTTPRDAYFVKCDKDTTTQNDINLGIVNILVGFAPLKPAEFVVIKIQQMAGNLTT
jgi:hypothetical protein